MYMLVGKHRGVHVGRSELRGMVAGVVGSTAWICMHDANVSVRSNPT
jgi:hypothetical protein